MIAHTLTSAQVSDQSLPKSRRQQKDEKVVPRHTDYAPPPKENSLKRKRADAEAEQDPKLKEFLEVMQPPSKSKSWANDDTQPTAGNAPAEDTVEEAVVPEDESDNDYQVIAKKPKTVPSPNQAPPDPEVTSRIPDKRTADNEEQEHTDQPMEENEIAPAGGNGPVSDADWLRSRTNRVLDLVDDDEATSRPTDERPMPLDDETEAEGPSVSGEVQVVEPEDLNPVEAPTVPSEEDKIRQTGRLYLRNLHYDVKSDDIEEYFSKYGNLEEVRPCSFFYPYRYDE